VSVEVGDKAPDFTLRDQHKQEVTLSDFRGQKNVVLLFYPFAFTGVCTGELCGIRDELADFDNDNVAVLAVSTDTTASLRIFADQEKLDYPLLSDFWPHGEVARAYGVFDERIGFAIRGTFLVDTAGVLRWSMVNGPGEARPLSAYREAVAGLA
jgi:mycoredoxin-dependent peroxiredoxin